MIRWWRHKGQKQRLDPAEIAELAASQRLLFAALNRKKGEPKGQQPMNKMLKAEELLRVSNDLLECIFWCADSLADRGAAIASSITEVQEKIGLSRALIRGDDGADQPKREM